MYAVRVIPAAAGGRVEVQEVPQPVAGSRQVLVRVRASGLNRGEITQAKDRRSGEPITAGVEFAGEVADVGAEVTSWKPGDRVMGHGRECQAQYVLSDPRALMRVPDAMSWIEAATFPNVYVTAHDALVVNGELKRGESVLVNGASDGVALAAIQIAALFGAKPVIATSRSAAKLERLTALGVDVAIDSARSQAEAVMAATGNRGVDVIVDTVGGPAFEQNMNSLAIKGRLVQIARLGGSTAQIDLSVLWLRRLKLVGVTFRTRSEEERLACIEACARDLLPHLEAGRIRPVIDRTFPFENVVEAHAYMQRSEHFGKIVLTVE